ncbi:hypothetical protein JXA12_01685 [Candidatus Woesearchaeota archaeon]|nr:hypothetical protein [Candidatus Woesearchaeota archaeon]
MNKRVSQGFTAAFLLVIMTAATSAAPGVPHQFYGDVLVNDEPAPDLYLVEAVINGVAKQVFVIDGQYGHEPIFYIEDPNNDRQGDKIRFYVGPDEDNLKLAATYTFDNGQSTELDLSVEIDTGDDDGGSSGGGSSSSSSSSSSNNNIIITTTGDDDNATDDDDNETIEIVTCTPDWVCTAWGECANGQQTRTCADKNQCGTDDGMPAERQSCEIENMEAFTAPPATQKEGVFNRITGAVVGGGATSWILLVAFLLVIAGIIGLVAIRQKKAKD